MDVNDSFSVGKIISQSAFHATEISNKDLREKKIRDDKNVNVDQYKKEHVDSSIISIQPIDELKDAQHDFVTGSKAKIDKESLSDICDNNLSDPKIGKNVDIDR
ncbi:hypothetical protein [Borrelia sp. HM]|uniref:hypothetical protein n=1 Tax=Borrelia sp. HM TaxID=1882662 RepID=UPI001C78D243|nr:hypothetical protein [Borrelia sp. HM]BCR21704.1 hypothetical protein BKFM_00270 [Borrelia sp. HM]